MLGLPKRCLLMRSRFHYDHGFDGVLYFRAKTSELVEYYQKEFGANAPARYAPFRMIILEEAAAEILSDFM